MTLDIFVDLGLGTIPFPGSLLSIILFFFLEFIIWLYACVCIYIPLLPFFIPFSELYTIQYFVLSCIILYITDPTQTAFGACDTWILEEEKT